MSVEVFLDDTPGEVRGMVSRDGRFHHLLLQRDDPVIRTNRAVALAEVEGPAAALDALLCIDVQGWLPLHAARAEMFARLGWHKDARQDYDAALALGPSPAEALFLQARRDRLNAAA